jgi:Large-conductance mechanosensitive channel, MscL
MLKGFKNFLMRGDVIVVAVGLSVGFGVQQSCQGIHDIISPVIASAQGGVKGPWLGWQLVSGGATAPTSTLARSFPPSSTSSSYGCRVFPDRRAIQVHQCSSHLKPKWAEYSGAQGFECPCIVTAR